MEFLDQLLIALGFRYDPAGMRRFQRDIRSTTRLIGIMSREAVKLSTALAGVAVVSTRATDEVGKLAREIDESVQNIDALTHAQNIAGGSAQGMTSSLRELSISAAEAARGIGDGVEAFGILGISSTDAQDRIKPIKDLLVEVSGAIQGLDNARQLELADKLGIREAIRLLQLGPDAIQQLFNDGVSLGTILDKDAAIADEFQDALFRLWRIIATGARVITRELAPVLQGVIDTFTDWFRINREILEQDFPGFVEDLVKQFKTLVTVVGFFIAYRLASHMAVLAAAILRVGIFATAMNLAFLALPLIVAGIVAAIAALAEDAKVFFEGGDSFIGEMLKKYPEWNDELRTAAAIFATISDLTGLVLQGWKDIFALFEGATFEGFLDNLKRIPGFLTSLVDFTPQDLINSLPDNPRFNPHLDPDPTAAAEDAALKRFLSVPDNQVDNFLLPDPEFNQIGPPPGTTGSAVQNIFQISGMEIRVEGGTSSPQAISESVFELFQQAAEDLKTPVEQ